MNEWMRKIQARKWWLLLLLFVGSGAVYVGKAWLFKEAYCPRLQDVILYVTALLAILAVLLWASLTRNNSLIAKLSSMIVLVGGILAFSTVAGAVLASIPHVQMVYCPPWACYQAEFSQTLREEGKLEAAMEAARECLSKEPATSNEAACQRKCAWELAMALYMISNPDGIPGPDEVRCKEAMSQLEEAYAIAQRYGHSDLMLSIEERQRRLNTSCVIPTPTPSPTFTPSPTPVPTPTPSPSPTRAIELEVFRTRQVEGEIVIDVRVWEREHFLQGLKAEAFSLLINGQPAAFSFEARGADDPVCLIAVVDNSGSVAPGLDQIRNALVQLNEVRKPNDELGMVVFGAHNEIFTRFPSTQALDPEAVDASSDFTALWDGVLKGLDLSRFCSVADRHMVVLTDGRDNDSQLLDGDSLARAMEVAQRARDLGVGICTIGVRSEELETEPLRRAAYGCGYYPAENFDEVASLFVYLFGYVRDFYRLRVEVTSAPPEAEIILRVLDSVEVGIDRTGRNP